MVVRTSDVVGVLGFVAMGSLPIMSIMGSIGGPPPVPSPPRNANAAALPNDECSAIIAWVTCAETPRLDHSAALPPAIQKLNSVMIALYICY